MIVTELCFEWPSKEDVGCTSQVGEEGPQEECCFIGNDRTAGLYFHYLLSLYHQPTPCVQFIILINLFFSLLFIPIQSDHLCMSGLFFLQNRCVWSANHHSRPWMTYNRVGGRMRADNLFSLYQWSRAHCANHNGSQ